MRRYTIPLCALLIAATIVIAGSADAGTRPHRACPTEDSAWCVWDARHMGNGKGRSFWADRRGRPHYVSHATAHRLWRH